MKKSELLKLKPQYATPAMMRSAANDTPKREKLCYREYVDRYKTSFYMRGKKEGKIVRIAIFFAENMKLGSRKPTFEIYIDIDARNFVTYDFKHCKWLTAKIDLLPFPASCRWDDSYNNRELDKFIKKYLNTKSGGFNGVLEYQRGVRQEQLKARRKKETDPWDETMSSIPQEPMDWKKWVNKCGITQNYIFYNYRKGGAEKGYCSWCEKEVAIKNPKHNKKGKCSRCGHDIQYKATGKAGSFYTNRETVYLLQKHDDGFVLREYTVYKKYYKGEYTSPELCVSEEVRVIFDRELHSERYYYGLYKQDAIRWIYNGNSLRDAGYYYNSYPGAIYRRTLPSLKGVLSRTGLTEMIYQLPQIDVEAYLAALRREPRIEQLAKAGLTRLAYDVAFSWHFDKLKIENSSELGKSLHIDKWRLGRLRECNGGALFLEWLKFEKSRNKHIDDDVIKWFAEQKIKPEEIEFISDRMSERAVKNYLVRQQIDTKLPIKEIISMWDDYLKMAVRAKMNVNDEIVYRTRKLRQRHDEIVERLGGKELAIRAGDIALKFPNVDSVCEEIQSKYEYQDATYAILVPKNIEDILNEGETLNHCISRTDRYFERIDTRETYLLFLRKKEDLSRPWYTLEVEPDGTIRQKRTEYDRQNKDLKDAENFLSAWQKFVRVNITEDDIKLSAESRSLRIKELAEMRENNVKISHGHLAGHMLADVLEADLTENIEVGS